MVDTCGGSVGAAMPLQVMILMEMYGNLYEKVDFI